MSGGFFDYRQYQLNDLACEVEDALKTSSMASGLRLETVNEFRIAARKLREAAIYLQRIDWLLSGDDGEDTFHERLNKDLTTPTNTDGE